MMIQTNLYHRRKGMATEKTEQSNGGVFLPPVVEDERGKEDITLYRVFVHLIESIFDPNNGGDLMAHRIKKLWIDTAPMFREAILNTRRDLLLWTRSGSPLRALLVISGGIVSVLGLTGMLVFMLFVVTATVNAIVISLLISLAAVGGFLAILFTCLTAMYIVVLFIGAFVTFTVTISSVIAALVATGWIGFIWIIWLAVSKSASLAKRIAEQANVSGQHKSGNFKTEQ